MWLMAYNVAVIGKQSHWACRGVKSFFFKPGIRSAFLSCSGGCATECFQFFVF